jgi:hypothetical protein
MHKGVFYFFISTIVFFIVKLIEYYKHLFGLNIIAAPIIDIYKLRNSSFYLILLFFSIVITTGSIIVLYYDLDLILVDNSSSIKLSMAAILGTSISISIPFTLNAVSRHSDRYKDQEISSIILHDPYYKLMIYFVLPLIPILILTAVVKDNTIIDITAFILFLYSILILLFYLKKLASYSTNFDTIVKDYYKKIANECIKP